MNLQSIHIYTGILLACLLYTRSRNMISKATWSLSLHPSYAKLARSYGTTKPSWQPISLRRTLRTSVKQVMRFDRETTTRFTKSQSNTIELIKGLKSSNIAFVADDHNAHLRLTMNIRYTENTSDMVVAKIRLDHNALVTAEMTQATSDDVSQTGSEFRPKTEDKVFKITF